MNKPRSRWLICLCLVVLFTGLFLPLSFSAEEDRDLFCRDDGICLPPPLDADEFLARLEEDRDEVRDRPEAISCDVALVIKRADNVSSEAFRKLLEEQGYTQIEGLLVPQWWRVCSQDASIASAELETLTSLPQVIDAEIDGNRSVSFTPNDPYYSLQWGLPKVQAPHAWNLTLGSTQVLVSIVDSGFDYFHPDRPADAWLGWDFIHNDNDPWDDNGHGTHVTGIATAAGNNGIGISGLCPLCSTLYVKVLDNEGRGSTSDSANGIAFAADAAVHLGKQSIINLSLGGSYSSLEASAVDYALDKGAVIIAAAGNGGPGNPTYPAALPGVGAITATSSNDWPASFSQYGNLGAPGESILSTLPPWHSNPPYGYASGTSMAAPLVSAAAGLVWSYRPNYTPNQVIQALMDNADVPPGWNSFYGVGRLNVYRAVQQGAPANPTPTRTMTPTVTRTPTRTPTPTMTPMPTPTRTPFPPEYPRRWLPMTIK